MQHDEVVRDPNDPRINQQQQTFFSTKHVIA